MQVTVIHNDLQASRELQDLPCALVPSQSGGAQGDAQSISGKSADSP